LMSKRLGRKRYKALAANPTYTAFARGLTFAWFTFTLLWFWSSWKQIAFISHTLGAPAVVAIWAVIFFAAVPMLSLWELARNWLLSIEWNDTPVLLSRYTRTVWDTALFTTTVAVILLLHAPAPDLVYKSF
jgi:alginate O-acetyltransferase complex protein AlgI